MKVLQSKQRLLELNSKLADTLTSKGVTATADETTTSLINKVSDISIGGGDDGVLASLIDRSITSVVIPDSVTSIGAYAFQSCTKLTSIVIPDGVTSIGGYAFASCTSLTSVTIPDGVTSIGSNAFYNCTSLTSITIPDTVTSIGQSAFSNCRKLAKIIIPESMTSIASWTFNSCESLTDITIHSGITSIGVEAFRLCTGLKNVTLGVGFNANNLNLSSSKLIERETMVNMFNALADRTGLTAYTLTLGSTNLAKLTEQDILIATNKNWTLA